MGSQHQSLGGYKYTMSSTSKVASSSLETAAGISGGFGCFSAAVHSQTEAFRSNEYTSWSRTASLNFKTYEVFSLVDSNFYHYLLDEHKPWILSASPADIVSRLGEFFPTAAQFGGAMFATYQSEVTASDTSDSFEVDARASYEGVTASGSVAHVTRLSFNHCTWLDVCRSECAMRREHRRPRSSQRVVFRRLRAAVCSSEVCVR